MQNTKIFTISVVVAVGAALLASSSYAQSPAERYPTPALSPWFNLYQKHAGPLDNYNMFVRPEMQLRNTLQNQQNNIQSQGASLTNQGQQLTQLEENRRGVAPTGTPTGFMNQTRYFGLSNSLGQTGLAGEFSRPPARTPTHGTWSLPSASAHSGGR